MNKKQCYTPSVLCTFYADHHSEVSHHSVLSIPISYFSILQNIWATDLLLLLSQQLVTSMFFFVKNFQAATTPCLRKPFVDCERGSYLEKTWADT